MINEMEVRQIMNEQTVELNVLLTQHSFQTHDSVTIINTALLHHCILALLFISAINFQSELQHVKIQLDTK